jgi:hypothetical protein
MKINLHIAELINSGLQKCVERLYAEVNENWRGYEHICDGRPDLYGNENEVKDYYARMKACTEAETILKDLISRYDESDDIYLDVMLKDHLDALRQNPLVEDYSPMTSCVAICKELSAANGRTVRECIAAAMTEMNRESSMQELFEDWPDEIDCKLS